MKVAPLALVIATAVAASDAKPINVHLRSQFVKNEGRHPQHVWSREQELASGIKHNNYRVGTAPHEIMDDSELPEAFTWW